MCAVNYDAGSIINGKFEGAWPHNGGVLVIRCVGCGKGGCTRVPSVGIGKNGKYITICRLCHDSVGILLVVWVEESIEQIAGMHDYLFIQVLLLGCHVQLIQDL